MGHYEDHKQERPCLSKPSFQITHTGLFEVMSCEMGFYMIIN